MKKPKLKVSVPLSMLAGVLLAGVLLPLAAQAQGTVRLYAGPAKTTYKITFDNNADSRYRNKTAKADYTATNVGLTWVSSIGLYVDLSGQQSGNATHDLWTDRTSQPQDFSHTSYLLTVGYSRVFDRGGSLSGFGGFKSGRTELAAPRPPLPWSQDKFDSRGIFVGMGGGFPALGGQFSASGAIGIMSGKWTDDNGFDNSADSTLGYSAGFGYTYKFTQSLGLTADYKFQMYNYDFSVYATTPEYTVKEKISSLGLRLSYQF